MEITGTFNPKTRVWDGTTIIKYPTTAASSITAASGQNILAAGGGAVKNRIFLLSISVDTAGLVTIADGIGKVYLPANGTYVFDFGGIGVKQTTANTAITCTNAGGGNFTAYVLYTPDA